MYNQHFGFSQAPFNLTPDGRFFFVNPCYEEAFATLSYGIEARKGFIVVTGEPGTGKTTLLKRWMLGLDAKVQAVCIFDPHLSFIELLRVTLAELGVTSAADDRLTMMSELYDHLVRQFENRRVVCLLIDEAQNLSAELLEELRLFSNLETDAEKLFQIVLVGQPEFEKRLDSAELVQLKQRVVLRCRLRPLKAHEIGPYIDARLKTAHFTRSDLFDAVSLERIAHYSRGIPRLINSICDNALLIAYTANRRFIQASDIDEAAQELKLAGQPLSADKAAPQQTDKSSAAKGFEPKPDHSSRPWDSTWVKRTPADFEPRFQMPRDYPPFRNQRRTSAGRHTGILWVMLLAAGMVLFFNTAQPLSPLPDMSPYIEKIRSLTGNGKSPQPTQPLPKVEEPAVPPLANQEKIGSEAHSSGAERIESYELAAPETVIADPLDKAPEIGPEPPTKKTAEHSDKKALLLKSRPPADPLTDRPNPMNLEIEVYKAIRARAITGVHIASIDDGMVYLDGRVASPRQKLAALRAALSVPGVTGVRDRIVVQGGVESPDPETVVDRNLEAEVYRAIRERAISGVRIVSIDDGTVYLDGEVPTTRQKLAALRAALSVPGVKNVRDQIIIK